MHSRRFTFLLRTFIAAALALSLASCDSKSNEPDLEEEQVQYLYFMQLFNTALTDFRTACVRATSAGLDCATAGGGSYQSYLSQNVAVNTSSSDPTTICESYENAALLSSFSGGAKVCWFNCERGYWNYGISNGNCSSDYANFQSGAFTVSGNCLAECLGNSTVFLF